MLSFVYPNADGRKGVSALRRAEARVTRTVSRDLNKLAEMQQKINSITRKSNHFFVVKIN